jgi:caffeoyl-CoA O-methyltransferase
MSHPSDAPIYILHPEVRGYVSGLEPEPDRLLAALEARAAERGFPLVGRSSGQLMELLCRSIGARRVFEFGSGFGYSAYFFARAVGPSGEVIGSEKDAHELEDHRRIYAGHSLASRVDIRQGGAFEILDGTDGLFDAVLIDVDKEAYPQALERAIDRVRPGGLIFADNVLWGGKVARTAAEGDVSTAAIQRFNRTLKADHRLQTELLAVGDGLSVSLRLS